MDILSIVFLKNWHLKWDQGHDQREEIVILLKIDRENTKRSQKGNLQKRDTIL